MSNSQNKKNEQQNNLCTTLTEQWKKGELPYGYYYIKTISGGEVIDRYYRDCTDYDLCEYGDVWENRFEDEIIEVLAHVPSYEEWQQLKEDYVDKHDKYLRLSTTNHQLRKFLEEFNALDVAKENQQLKELLKECEDVLLTYSNISGDYELYDKITNAIGEQR